jgi:hypothetical protein
MFCPCGMTLDTTSANSYAVATYNGNGEIVYAVCVHGIVVIDKRPKVDPAMPLCPSCWPVFEEKENEKE